MVAEAARSAFRDAGVSVSSVDMGVAACGSNHFNRQKSLGHVVHETVGLVGKPTVRVEGGGATGALAIRTAVMAIRAGEARSVLVFGAFAAPYALMFTEHMRPSAPPRSSSPG